MIAKIPAVSAALSNLDGCPVGGWPETQQAIRRLREALPDGIDVERLIADEFAIRHDRYRRLTPAEHVDAQRERARVAALESECARDRAILARHQARQS